MASDFREGVIEAMAEVDGVPLKLKHVRQRYEGYLDALIRYYDESPYDYGGDALMRALAPREASNGK